MKWRLPHITVWRVFASAVFGLGLYATYVRFSQGLGAATNLSDAYPWGLWIGFDVLVGVGLAAGGFSIAATVHIFHLDAYKPVARPAIFTAFIGYLLVVVGLLFDLGQPWDIWHPLVMWNPHSVMFEVAWCVMLYTAVLGLEFSPVIFERFGMKAPLRFVRRLYLPLVIAGVLLSMLHQSSLGTLYVIMPDKLYGLWYTPLLPVFFFINALAAGLAMTIVESYLSHRAFGRELEHHLLEGLARVCVVLLAVYAVWRVGDLLSRDHLRLACDLTPQAVMFWGEMLLGIALPMTMMALPRLRAGEHSLFIAALLTVLGFITNRLNVAITGWSRGDGTSYFPSMTEFALTASLVVFGFVAFRFAVTHLGLFPESADDDGAADDPPSGDVGIIGGRGIIALWVLLGLGVALYQWAERGNEIATQGQPEVVAPKRAQKTVGPSRQPTKRALKLPAPHAFAKGAKSPGVVTFDHESHVDAKAPQCVVCHEGQFKLLSPMPLWGKLTMKRIEAGELCGSCHQGKIAFGIKDSCDSCHETD